METVESLGGLGEIARTLSVIVILSALIIALLSGKLIVPAYVANDLRNRVEKYEAALERRNDTASEATVLAQEVAKLASHPQAPQYFPPDSDMMLVSRADLDEIKDAMRRQPPPHSGGR